MVRRGKQRSAADSDTTLPAIMIDSLTQELARLAMSRRNATRSSRQSANESDDGMDDNTERDGNHPDPEISARRGTAAAAAAASDSPTPAAPKSSTKRPTFTARRAKMEDRLQGLENRITELMEENSSLKTIIAELRRENKDLKRRLEVYEPIESKRSKK